MRFSRLIFVSLFCLVFQPQNAHAAPEISPELIYGEWEAEGKTWKFYSTDLSRPEYAPNLLRRPDRPSISLPREPDDPLYDLQVQGRLYDQGNKDPLGLRQDEKNNALTIVVGIRDIGNDEVLDTIFLDAGRYVDNRAKFGVHNNSWDLADMSDKYPMPEPTELPEGDDMHKKVRTPVFCGPHPEYLALSSEERKSIQFPLVVTFPPEVTYRWIDFKFSVDEKTKEVQAEAEVWNVKRYCRYKYTSRLFNNENISTHEVYVSNRFKLTPVESRYAKDYPDYSHGKSEGAQAKQAF